MSWRGDSDVYTLLNVYTLLDCNVLTTIATQSALRVGTTSEVYKAREPRLRKNWSSSYVDY